MKKSLLFVVAVFMLLAVGCEESHIQTEEPEDVVTVPENKSEKAQLLSVSGNDASAVNIYYKIMDRLVPYKENKSRFTKYYIDFFQDEAATMPLTLSSDLSIHYILWKHHYDRYGVFSNSFKLAMQTLYVKAGVSTCEFPELIENAKTFNYDQYIYEYEIIGLAN